MQQTQTVFRSEHKYLLNYDKALQLRKRLELALKRDAHATNSGYMVRSLYFDSINQQDFCEKDAGTEIRKKVRLRVYSTEDRFCKLEVKQKNGSSQKKTSLSINRGDAQVLIQGDYSVLTKYFSSHPEASKIYQWMMLECYRPVALIEYNRIAYTYPKHNTRITFDSNIRTSESCIDIFRIDPLYYPVINEKVVLEVKFDQHLMKFISDILKPFQLTACSVSKYCSGRPVFYEYG